LDNNNKTFVEHCSAVASEALAKMRQYGSSMAYCHFLGHPWPPGKHTPTSVVSYSEKNVFNTQYWICNHTQTVPYRIWLLCCYHHHYHYRYY